VGPRIGQKERHGRGRQEREDHDQRGFGLRRSLDTLGAALVARRPTKTDRHQSSAANLEPLPVNATVTDLAIHGRFWRSSHNDLLIRSLGAQGALRQKKPGRTGPLVTGPGLGMVG